jgi:uncharacterized coiled-coil protein SlyX
MFRRLIAIFALSVFALTACSSGSDSSFSYNGGGAEPGLVEEAASSADGSKVSIDTSVIRTGDMSLEISDIDTAIKEVTDAVTSHGGTIQDSSKNNDSYSSYSSASLVARIPAENLDAAVAEISKLGKVQYLNLYTSDVTLQKVDLEARVASLETSIARLNDLMAKATTTSELIAAESALAERQGELDSLTSQLDYLDSQIAKSTLSIFLNEPSSSLTSGLRGFKQTFIEMARRFIGGFEEVVIFIGAFLPWAIVLGGLGLGARSGRRAWQNRQKKG